MYTTESYWTKPRQIQKLYGKCPLLIDPSHSTSGSLPVHLGPIDGHMRCPIIQFYKKWISQNLRTDGRTEKKWLLKIPFAKRSGSKKYEIPSLILVISNITPTHNHLWFRRRDGVNYKDYMLDTKAGQILYLTFIFDVLDT